MSNKVITTLLTAASSYNLTDLPTVKSELGVTDTVNDPFLLRGITQVSKATANYCNRVFPVETLTDLLYLDRDALRNDDASLLQLSRWPVVRVASVIQDVGLASQLTLVAGTDYQLKGDTGQLLRMDSTSGAILRWSARTVTVQYSAGFGAQTTQVASIPGSPYQVTITNASGFALDVSVLQGATLFTAVSGAPAAGQYSVSAGVYTFNAADSGKSVSITYLYTVIPDDLVEACLRLLTLRFKAKGRDPLLMSEESPGVGHQRWWVGAAQGQSGAFPPEIEDILDPYYIPTVA